MAEVGDTQLGYLPFQHWQSITLARMGELAEARRLREQMLHEELKNGRRIDAFYSAIEMAEVCRIAGDLPEAQRYLKGGHDLLAAMQLGNSWKLNAHGTYCRIAGAIALDEGDYAAARGSISSRACPGGRARISTGGPAIARQGWAALRSGWASWSGPRRTSMRGWCIASRGFGDMNVLTRALAGVVELLAARQQTADAYELATHLAALPGTWEIKQRAAALRDRLAACLSADEALAAQRPGRAADLDTTVTRLLALLSAAADKVYP